MNKNEGEVLETRSEKIWLGEDGIIRHISLPVNHNLVDAQESIRLISTNFCKNRRRPALVDIRKINDISVDARQYYAGKKTANVHSAVAIMVDSNFTRIIANFFIGLNKTIFPTKIFTSEEEALEWLKEFVE